MKLCYVHLYEYVVSMFTLIFGYVAFCGHIIVIFMYLFILSVSLLYIINVL